MEAIIMDACKERVQELRVARLKEIEREGIPYASFLGLGSSSSSRRPLRSLQRGPSSSSSFSSSSSSSSSSPSTHPENDNAPYLTLTTVPGSKPFRLTPTTEHCVGELVKTISEKEAFGLVAELRSLPLPATEEDVEQQLVALCRQFQRHRSIALVSVSVSTTCMAISTTSSSTTTTTTTTTVTPSNAVVGAVAAVKETLRSPPAPSTSDVGPQLPSPRVRLHGWAGPAIHALAEGNVPNATRTSTPAPHGETQLTSPPSPDPRSPNILHHSFASESDVDSGRESLSASLRSVVSTCSSESSSASSACASPLSLPACLDPSLPTPSSPNLLLTHSYTDSKRMSLLSKVSSGPRRCSSRVAPSPSPAWEEAASGSITTKSPTTSPLLSSNISLVHERPLSSPLQPKSPLQPARVAVLEYATSTHAQQRASVHTSTPHSSYSAKLALISPARSSSTSARTFTSNACVSGPGCGPSSGPSVPRMMNAPSGSTAPRAVPLPNSSSSADLHYSSLFNDMLGDSDSDSRDWQCIICMEEGVDQGQCVH